MGIVPLSHRINVNVEQLVHSSKKLANIRSNFDSSCLILGVGFQKHLINASVGVNKAKVVRSYFKPSILASLYQCVIEI